MKHIFLSLLILFSSFHIKAQKYFGQHLAGIVALANNTGPGLGIRYEHFFANDKFAIVAPVNFCFSYVAGKHYLRPGIETSGDDKRPLMVFAEPGIRFYPTKSSGVVRYALGTHLVIGEGKGASNLYTNGTNELQSRSIFGVAISNSVNFHITKHVRVGLDLSLGICDDNGVNAAAEPGSINPFGQLTFNIGGRF